MHYNYPHLGNLFKKFRLLPDQRIEMMQYTDWLWIIPCIHLFILHVSLSEAKATKLGEKRLKNTAVI